MPSVNWFMHVSCAYSYVYCHIRMCHTVHCGCFAKWMTYVNGCCRSVNSIFIFKVKLNCQTFYRRNDEQIHIISDNQRNNNGFYHILSAMNGNQFPSICLRKYTYLVCVCVHRENLHLKGTQMNESI